MKTFKILVTFTDGAKVPYEKNAETFAGACLLVEASRVDKAFIKSFELLPAPVFEPVNKRFTQQAGRNARVIKKAERLY